MPAVSKKHLLVATGALALALLVVAEPALADSSGIGKNLGNEVRSWATALLLGVAALVGLPALARRDLSQSLVIAVIVLVLGGFIFAEGTVKTVIETMWKTLGG